MNRGILWVLAILPAANLFAAVPYWDAKGSLEAPDRKISADTKGRYWEDTSSKDKPDCRVAVDLKGEWWDDFSASTAPDLRVSVDFDGKYWESANESHERPDLRISLDFGARHWKDIGTSRPSERAAMRIDNDWGGRQVAWGLTKSHWEDRGIRSSPDRRMSFDLGGAKWDETGTSGPDRRISLDMTGRYWEDRSVSSGSDLRLSISYDRNGPTQDVRQLVLVWLSQREDL